MDRTGTYKPIDKKNKNETKLRIFFNYEIFKVFLKIRWSTAPQ
jgi:hypothetical protein